MEFIILIITIGFFIFAIKNLMKVINGRKSFLKENKKFKKGKRFNLADGTSVFVSPDGDIALAGDKKEYYVINISDIIDWDIIENGGSKKKVSGAIAGGLLFGGIGLIAGSILGGNKNYVNDLRVILKTNNFDNPVKELVFINHKVSKSMAKVYLKQMQELATSLEILSMNK